MADREADSDGLNFNAFYMWSKSLNESETDGGANGTCSRGRGGSGRS